MVCLISVEQLVPFSPFLFNSSAGTIIDAPSRCTGLCGSRSTGNSMGLMARLCANIVEDVRSSSYRG